MTYVNWWWIAMDIDGNRFPAPDLGAKGSICEASGLQVRLPQWRPAQVLKGHCPALGWPALAGKLHRVALEDWQHWLGNDQQMIGKGESFFLTLNGLWWEPSLRPAGAPHSFPLQIPRVARCHPRTRRRVVPSRVWDPGCWNVAWSSAPGKWAIHPISLQQQKKKCCPYSSCKIY